MAKLDQRLTGFRDPHDDTHRSGYRRQKGTTVALRGLLCFPEDTNLSLGGRLRGLTFPLWGLAWAMQSSPDEGGAAVTPASPGPR